MKSVWIVEEGAYSDYRVVAIFSTQAQAEEFCSHHVEAECREWILDTWSESQIRFEFKFDLQGNIIDSQEKAFTEADSPDGDALHSYRHDQKEIKIVVQRGPRDLAVKIASEHYTRIRAFLDEADERMDRANYSKNGYYRWNDALEVARILAGIDQPPNPPQCEHHRIILVILGIEPIKTAIA